MASTPNAPNSLFWRIEQETGKESIHQPVKLDYTFGLNKIYSLEEIEKQMQSPFL